MKIFCIGDIVGKPGRRSVNELLPLLQKEHGIDFTIANAENAAGGSGLTPRIAEQLYRFGCDVITMGDHVWDRPEIHSFLNENPNIIRPANFPEGSPGKGWCITTSRKGIKVGIINLLGRTFIRYNVNCPFLALESILPQIQKETNIIIVDIHAEATSEKVALGHFSDGKVSGIFGTHTHIQTADEKVLPGGTAYITDCGMTGPYDSVIGQNKEKIIQRFLTSMPTRFEVAVKDAHISGAVMEIDETSGRAKHIFRIHQAIPDAPDDSPDL